MSDSSKKYDSFMEELNDLEKQVYVLVQNVDELKNENQDLQEEVNQIAKEREVLKLELEETQAQLSNINSEGLNGLDANLFGTEEKEKLKNKIGDLISKIDYHLRS